MGLVLFLLMCLFASSAVASGPIAASSSDEIGQPQHLTMMIVYTLVALGFSFLCSVAEAVILSVSPAYIASLKNSGKVKQAAQLDKVKSKIDRSLAAILTLNTIAHTVGAGGAGAEAAAYFGDEYVGVAMAVLTLLILFISEIIPKTLGATYWRSLSGITAQFIQFLTYALFPLIFVSEIITKLISGGHGHNTFNRDEFTAQVDVGEEAGQLDATESRILKNLLRFPELVAEDIMTPRTVVFALQQDMTIEQVNAEHPEINFSRIPIFAKNKDEVTGFVLKTDILLKSAADEFQATLKELARPITATYENTPLSLVLENVLDNREHILLVTDEHGGLEGVVTLEDVVETLIGIEIVDEADTIDDMRKLAREKWEARMKNVGVDVRNDENTDA
ncbi:MAG: hemolysin [Blastopirellula sp.]|nr:MAG: hemolysin [Blastopirellula sp.]